ncbi:MAG: hypothetical protein SFV21_15875 [Rhodospirillaceae bacterium]|nr:hypothetical protein [Rhodospirillaceae bacterium]
MLGLGAQAHAQAPGTGDCPPYGAPVEISFSMLDPEPALETGLNVTSLRDFLRTRGHVFAGRHQRTLGVTSYQARFVVGGRSYAVPIAGGFCVYLREIEVEYGYLHHDVFVASELAPGSCEYKAVLDHENQHVAINRAMVREGAQLIRRELERRLAVLEPKFSREPQLGTDRAIAELQLAASPVLDGIEQTQAARNAALDTAGAYDAIGELCSDWDQGTVWPKVDTGSAGRVTSSP